MEKKKISKRQTTLFNKFTKLEQRLKDIYSKARSYSMDHESILKEKNERIWNTKEFKSLTLYYKGILCGIDSTLLSSLYYQANDNWLEWLHEYNGELYGKWEDLPKDVKYDNKLFKSNHYWVKTGKPFSEITNKQSNK